MDSLIRIAFHLHVALRRLQNIILPVYVIEMGFACVAMLPYKLRSEVHSSNPSPLILVNQEADRERYLAQSIILMPLI